MVWDKVQWEEVGGMDFDTWDYEQVKMVQGVLKEKRTNVGKNKSNLYVLEQPNGELIGVWGTALLDPRFSTLEVGDKIRIEYLGLEKAEKSGRNYHNFKVLKEKREKEPVEGELSDEEIASKDIPF